MKFLLIKVALTNLNEYTSYTFLKLVTNEKKFSKSDASFVQNNERAFLLFS